MRIPARLARLSFLQGVLPSGSHSIAPLSREMSRWFAELPADKPLAVMESLAQRVLDISVSTAAPSKRFRQVEQIIGHAEPLLRRFETQLDQCRLPLDSASKQAAGASDKLLKNLSEACIHIVQAIDASMLQRRLNGKIFALALLRAAQLILRRAQVAQRAHTPGSPRRWKLYRKLLTIAEQNNLSRLPPQAQSKDTVEQVIVRDCLMSLCDPASLEGGELGRIRFYIERFGHLVPLEGESPAEEDRGKGLFVFGDSPRGPARLKEGQELQEKERLLDCRPLIERATQQLTGLRQGLHATKLGLPMVANEASYAFMLSRCIEQWSEARSRRHLRQEYQPLAELVSGFDPVRQFLASSAFRRRESDKQQGAGRGLSVTSEWRILDQSRSGFGLRQAGAHTLPVSVGEVVAMRPLERSNVHICVVRRVRNDETDGCEIGLERLCGTAMPTSVDKPLRDGNIHSVPVLLLPRVQCFDSGPGLLAPPGDMSPGLSVIVEQREGNIHFEVVAVFERLASCELVQLKRV